MSYRHGITRALREVDSLLFLKSWLPELFHHSLLGIEQGKATTKDKYTSSFCNILSCYYLKSSGMATYLTREFLWRKIWTLKKKRKTKLNTQKNLFWFTSHWGWTLLSISKFIREVFSHSDGDLWREWVMQKRKLKRWAEWAMSLFSGLVISTKYIVTTSILWLSELYLLSVSRVSWTVLSRKQRKDSTFELRQSQYFDEKDYIQTWEGCRKNQME